MKRISFVVVFLAIWPTYAEAQSGWMPMGTGSNALFSQSGALQLIIDKGNQLYASGGKDTGGYFISRWDGSNWQKVGNSLRSSSWNNRPGIMMLDSAKNLYVLVPYKNASGKYNVSKWNGFTAQDLGTGLNALNANDDIYAVAADKAGNVYVFGNFTDSSGQPYVAKWNGVNWNSMGPWPYSSRPNYGHTLLYVDDSDNIFATSLGMANPSGNEYVSKWTTSGWQEVGAPNHLLQANGGYLNTMVKDHRGNLYVAGGMRDNNGTYFVAKWDGANWSAVGKDGTAINSYSYIGRLAVDASNRLYAISTFSGNNREYVSVWNDTTWKELGEQPHNLYVRGAIFSILADSGKVYVGGTLIMDTSNLAVYGPLPAATKVPVTTETNDVVVYPNPNKGVFEILFAINNFPGQTITVSLLDVSGRQSFCGTAQSTPGKPLRVELPAGLSGGNYTMCADGAGVHFVKEIRLER